MNPWRDPRARGGGPSMVVPARGPVTATSTGVLRDFDQAGFAECAAHRCTSHPRAAAGRCVRESNERPTSLARISTAIIVWYT